MKAAWAPWAAIALLAALPAQAAPAPAQTSAPASRPAKPKTTKPAKSVVSGCTGAYADSLVALSPLIHDRENSGQVHYVRLIRTEAIYETPFYANDGRLDKRRFKAAVYGTGLAYKKAGDELYFLTNAHVATFPNVTTEASRVDGVPTGSKKVREESRLVESDSDDNVDEQIKLTKVAVDLLTDAAILKTRFVANQNLQIMPYKIGESSDLKVGNFVYVRGYPLGVFQAVNVGRVITPLDTDREQGWYHNDFIIDALLSSGQSGSPVFAISCQSGALELVGMYHAAYRQGSALNAVIAIDELKDFIETFNPTKHSAKPAEAPLTTKDRVRLFDLLRDIGPVPVFPFAAGVASVDRLDAKRLELSIYDKDFPTSLERRLWLVDEATKDFAYVTRASFRATNGTTHTVEAHDFDAGLIGAVDGVYRALIRQLMATLEYRRARASGGTPTGRLGDMARELTKARAAQRELVDAALGALEDVAFASGARKGDDEN